MKSLKVILTHPASNDIDSLIAENIAYWQNRNDTIKGQQIVSNFLLEVDEALIYLETNAFHHVVKGKFHDKEIRFYCIKPSKKFSMLYYIQSDEVRVITVAPSRGKTLNDFFK